MDGLTWTLAWSAECRVNSFSTRRRSRSTVAFPTSPALPDRPSGSGGRGRKYCREQRTGSCYLPNLRRGRGSRDRLHHSLLHRDDAEHVPVPLPGLFDVDGERRRSGCDFVVVASRRRGGALAPTVGGRRATGQFGRADRLRRLDRLPRGPRAAPHSTVGADLNSLLFSVTAEAVRSDHFPTKPSRPSGLRRW